MSGETLFPQTEPAMACMLCRPGIPCWRHGAPPAPKLSPDARRTAANRELLDAGRHPATGSALLDAGWGFRCRDCAHLLAHRPNLRTFFKCELHHRGITGGPATDVRVSWPACTLLRIDAEAVPG